MEKPNTIHCYKQVLFRTATIAFLLIFIVSLFSIPVVQAGSPLATVGYLDFSYGTTAEGEPTAEKPESKLWWNDGFWWGSLYNNTASAYHIFRLDWGTQDWVDTGVALDDRPNSRADILWDATNKKLYVASHVFSLISSEVNQSINWARMYRYSYQDDTQTYLLDTGFPVTVNNDKTETMVMEKDSKGRLWVTYVSRDPSIFPDDAQVYFNRTTSTSNDTSWATPYSLGTLFPSAHVSTDDISSIIAFNNKIGIMWSNQLDGNFYFAIHDDNQSATTGWTLETIDSSLYSFTVNDHIHLAKDSVGDVFAAVKTSPTLVSGSLTGLLTRDASGIYSFHTLSGSTSNDTRPIVVVDDSQNKVFVFDTSRPIGGVICYQSADIVHPLSSMVLAAQNCGTGDPLTGSGVKQFIADAQYNTINNATSSKENVNNTTGLVVLASDDLNGQVYVHNVMGNPPPVITHRFPESGSLNAAFDTVVLATFSKEMNASTLTSSTFKLQDASGPISGTVAYDNTTRTASFTPSTTLKAETEYTVTLTNSVKDINGQVLFGAPETWKFTTQMPTVQFQQEFFSVLENGGTAVITATLSQPSPQTVTVQYATSDDTAHAPADYTASSGTLTFLPNETTKTFSVPIINNGVPNGNKTVNLTLTSPTHASLGTPVAGRLTILDDDNTNVVFNPGSFSVNEAAGFATIIVDLTSAQTQIVTVDYAASDGTAQAPGDYTASSGTLSFNVGETTKTFQVPIINDTLFEADETVHLTLSNPVNAVLGTPNDTAILTIKDDDPMPKVSFSEISYTVAENAGTAVITANLSAPSGLSSQVSYQVTDDTAFAGVDYSYTPGVLTFAPGETSKTFSISILDDPLSEPSKTAKLTLLSDPAPVNLELGDPATATLIITDDDPLPILQLSQSEYKVSEASGKATITVILNTPSGQSVSVDYATSDGTAGAGKDYDQTFGTLVFAPGETTQSFVIPLIKDKIPEQKEAFYLTLSNPVKVTFGTKITATIIINDGSKSIYMPLVSNALR